MKNEPPSPAPKAPEPEPVEPMLDMKSARQARGIGLKELYVQTRISPAVLEAIEDQRFDQLPAPLYTRSFIQTYCKCLGMDSGPLLLRYEKHLQGTLPPQPPPVITRERSSWRPSRKTVFTAALLSAAVALIVVLYRGTLSTDRFEPPPPTPAVSRPVSPLAGPEGETPPAAPQPQAEASPQQRGQKRLEIQAREQTWLRIREDDRAPYQVMLQAGERLEKTASRFVLDIGNVGGIEMVFEGKPVEIPGKRGQVVRNWTLP